MAFDIAKALAPVLGILRRSRARKKTFRQSSRGFARAIGLDSAGTNLMAREVKRGQRRVNRTLDKIPDRRGLAKRLESRGVTAQEFSELKRSSNARDRKLLEGYRKGQVKVTRRAASDAERRRARIRAQLIRGGIGRIEATQLTTPARGGSGKAPSISTAGLSSVASVLPRQIKGAQLDNSLRQIAALGTPAVRTAQGAAIVGEEFAKNPIRAVGDTATMGAAGLAEIPEVVVETAKETAKGNPLGPAKRLGRAWADDLIERYGPLYSGDTRAFRERLQRDGIAAEALDIAGILAGGGATAGRAAGAAARSGKLGRTARVFATSDRPELRLMGAAGRPQRLSKNLGVVAAQRTHDAIRRRRTIKKAAHSGGGAGGGDALAAAAKASGDVLPLNPRKIKRPVGQQKGATRLEQQAILDEMVREGAAARRDLSVPEIEALPYAIRYGARTNSRLREVLTRLADGIEDARRTQGFELKARDFDELPLIRRMAADPARYFTPRLDRLANDHRNRAAVTGRRDPTMAEGVPAARARRAQEGLLGTRRPDAQGGIPALQHNPDADLRALREMRRELGLAVGGYFPSRPGGPRTFGGFVTGSSLRAPTRHRQYSDRLRELGIESGDMHAFDVGLARNLNNELHLREVTRTIRQEALPWSMRSDRLPSSTPAAIYNRSVELGIDPNTWVVVSPRALDKAAELGDPSAAFDLSGGLERSAISGSAIKQNPSAYGDVPGYVAIPRAKWDEIRSLEQPTDKGARLWNNAKGGLSRLMLGLNPTFVPFQVAGNAAMSALGGGRFGGSRAFREAMRHLTPDEQRRANALLGMGQVSEAFNRQHLGSRAGQLAQSWHDFRGTRLGRAAGKLNLVSHNLQLDRAQNNMFRRSVAGSKLRKMEREMQAGAGVLDRLLGRARGTPEDYARILRNPEQLEQLAEHVNRSLGDYTSLTALERGSLAKYIMFYGWLRHSLRLMFWTMPTTRPIVGSVLGQLGKLHVNEIRAIFGDDAPAWLYFYSVLGRNREGQPIGINAARFIPFINAIAGPGSAENPAAALVSTQFPGVQGVLNSAYGKDLFTGRSLPRDSGLGDQLALALQTTIGQPLAPLRIGQRVLSPRRSDEGKPPWQILLEQTTPIPRTVPWSAGGPVDLTTPLTGSRGTGWTTRPGRAWGTRTGRAWQTRRSTRAWGR